MLDGAKSTVSPLGEFTGEEIRTGVKIGVRDLPLAGFIAVRGSDAAAGGTAGLLLQNIYPVIFPSEIKQAMREVRDHRALIDEKA